jgi:hypothetical protein
MHHLAAMDLLVQHMPCQRIDLNYQLKSLLHNILSNLSLHSHKLQMWADGILLRIYVSMVGYHLVLHLMDQDSHQPIGLHLQKELQLQETALSRFEMFFPATKSPLHARMDLDKLRLL